MPIVRLPQDRFYDWLRLKYPWMFGWKTILASLVFSVSVIVFGLWINPPSKVRQEFYRAHPELAPQSK
jgi:hypothetical protein